MPVECVRKRSRDERNEIRFVNLSRQRSREGSHDLYSLRPRLRSKPLLTKMLSDGGDRRKYRIGVQFDHGADTFSGPLIGQPDHDGVGHSWKQPKELFHFRRGNVLAVADHYILESSGDGDKAFIVDHPEVARSEKSPLVKNLRIK